MAASQGNENIRYEPEDRPPIPIAAGVGFQAAALTLPSIALTVVIVARVADQTDSYMQWAVFGALLVSGITTVLQARPRLADRRRPRAYDGHLGSLHRSVRRRP